MKRFIFVLLLVSCYNPTPAEIQVNFSQDLQDHLSCAWHYKYQLCFCGNALGWESGILTLVPDRVCGK